MKKYFEITNRAGKESYTCETKCEFNSCKIGSESCVSECKNFIRINYDYYYVICKKYNLYLIINILLKKYL